MNLLRLRELVKAWQDGSIREAELRELRNALPELLARMQYADDVMRCIPELDDSRDDLIEYADCYFLRYA